MAVGDSVFDELFSHQTFRLRNFGLVRSQLPVFVQICFENFQWLAGRHIIWQIDHFLQLFGF